MNNYSSVIIDFDGTLFDTRRAISSILYRTFAAYNVPPPSRERVEALIGRGVNPEETLSHLMLQSMPAAQLNEWVLTYRRIYDAGTGIHASTPFPGSRDALAELHAAGVPVVIVSNKGATSVQAILTHFSMHDTVHLVIAGRDACPSKADPRSYFERIAPVLGSAACEYALVAGDTDLDILDARRIGAATCGATYGYGDPDECQLLHPECVTANPNEIAHAVCASRPPFSL